MYTEDYEQEMDLKDLLFVLLCRWRSFFWQQIGIGAAPGGYKAVGNTQQTDFRQKTTRKRTGQL